MNRTSIMRHRLLVGLVLLAFGVVLNLPTGAKVITIGAQVDLEGRPVSDIQIEGLKQVEAELVLNQIRLIKGDAYDAQVVEQDIIRITHLNRFSSVQARAEQIEDGSVVVRYVVAEQPLISDVQVVGNKAFTDQKLLEHVVLRAGDPLAPFLIDRAIQAIEKVYRADGYSQVEVSIDRELLDESSVVLLRVREGPLVRIKKIHFVGNHAFPDKLMKSKIQSKAAMFIFRKGQMDREQLELDAASLRDYYRSEGYLDAQVGPSILTSPTNLEEAIVRFLIEEGPQYEVATIRVQGNHLLSSQQILEVMTLKIGDVYTTQSKKTAEQAIKDLYGKIGFIHTIAALDRLFHETAPLVDVEVTIDEGLPYKVGRVVLRGNELTKDQVIYRGIRGLDPGRRFDRTGVERTRQRLQESALFSEAKINILGDLEDEYRDVLIEVKEQNTGSVSFGAGISSDSGVLGAVNLVQRNFDIADWPDSLGEFFSGRAFRGAGQYFSLNVSPGNRFSTYSVSFREPYLMDAGYFMDSTFRLFDRERDDYDEHRLGGSLGIGKRFGDVWSTTVRGRADEVEIDNIDAVAPDEVRGLKGNNFITSLGLTISRNTTDSRVFPTRGSDASIGIRYAGLLGGDFDFTAATAEFIQFWTVDEDVFDRKSVLSLRMEFGYIFEDDEAPFFERLYAGGHRSFRGFEFRGVGPRGTRGGVTTDDPVGGEWLFLLGPQYHFPIYQEVLRGVIFLDTGTVQKDVGFSKYRVSIGTGLRLKVPFLGAAPVALDLAIPILKEDGDEEQIFSFDIALPF